MQVNCQFFCPPPQLLSRLSFLTFLFFLLLLPWQIKAQSNCMDWGIEVTKDPPLGQTGAGCVDGGDCDNLYYYVYLVRNGGGSPSNTYPFHFIYLTVGGELSVVADNNPNVPGTGTARSLSRLDEAASLACLPDMSIAGGALFQVTTDGDDQRFDYYIGIPNNGDDLGWTVGAKTLLCVVAVRAYPGEIVRLNDLKTSFQVISTLPHGLTSCQPPVIYDDLNKTLPLPPSCDPTLSLLVGNPQNDPTPEFPNRKKIPVSLTGPAGAYQVTDLDFLVKVKSEYPMAEVSAEAGTLAKEDISVYREVIFATDDIRIHVSTLAGLSLTLPATTPLFYIFIDGPVLLSACAKTTIELFGPSRIQIQGSTGLTCCQPDFEDKQEFSIGPEPCLDYCNPNVVLKIKRVDLFPSSADPCADLFFELEITNTTTGTSNVIYESGYIVIDAKYGDGTLSFDSYLADPAVPITNTNPVTTVTTGVPANTLRMAFDFMPVNPILLTPNNPKKIGIFQLTGTNVCANRISIYDAVLTATTGPNTNAECVLQLTDTEIGKLPKIGMGTIENDGICLQELVVRLETQYALEKGIAEGIVGITGNCNATSNLTNILGNVAICDCRQPGQNTLTPIKDNNHLNGVSTFDLVLITRHVLGLAALGNPYKMIAADANKSGSITSFDIVELRKLILGIYQTLPNNTSWRFIPKSFSFPNNNNPFETVFPEDYTYTMPSTPGIIEFYGIKIGDVNGNALPSVVGTSTVVREATTLPLGFHLPSARRGETTEIPLFVRQATDLAAWQLALRYDPARMRIKNVRWAMAAEPTPYEMADWYSPVPGELRMCWFDPMGTATHLDAQAPIAYLQVEWLGNPSQDANSTLELIQTIPGEAYGSDGQVANLALEAVPSYQAPVIVAKAVQPKPEWLVSAYPNPTGGIFRFEVSLPVGGEGRIGLYDPMGRLVVQQNISFTPGLNVVTSQQFPPLTTGIYFVRFDTPMGRQTLRLVKN